MRGAWGAGAELYIAVLEQNTRVGRNQPGTEIDLGQSDLGTGGTVSFGPHYICPFPAAASPCAGSPSHSTTFWECGICSRNINWAGNSLLSCRGCNRKRKNLSVSISLDFDGCIYPKRSTSVERCCVFRSPRCTAASCVSCHLCKLGASGKHLQSREYFSTVEKSGTSSQGAACTKEGGWGDWARSVCTTIPKLGTWKAREIHLVVTPKTIVLFEPLCCSLMPQLLLCNHRPFIKMTATVSTEILCSCKGGCLSNMSLVSKTSTEAKICSSRTNPWAGAALHRWAVLAGRGVPLLFGFRQVPHANNFISFCHSLSGRTGFFK